MVKSLPAIRIRRPRRSVSEVERLVADAACRCFVAYGYEQTTIDRILQSAKAAGVSRGSAYHACPAGKPGHAIATYRKIKQDLHSALRSAKVSPGSGLPKLIRDGLLKPYIAWVCTHQGEARFMAELEAIRHLGHDRTETEAGKAVQNELRTTLNGCRNDMHDVIKAVLNKAPRAGAALRKLPDSYLEAMILGPPRVLLADVLRGVSDRSVLQSNVGPLATAIHAALKCEEADSAKTLED